MCQACTYIDISAIDLMYQIDLVTHGRFASSRFQIHASDFGARHELYPPKTY